MSIVTNVIRKLGIIGSHLPRAGLRQGTLSNSRVKRPAVPFRSNVRLPCEVTEMGMQILKDSSGPVFEVTDLLRGARYFVADKGSHYEIQVPREAGYAKVTVSQKADVIDVADGLIRLLDNVDQLCPTSGASEKSSSPKGLEQVNESCARHSASDLSVEQESEWCAGKPNK